MVADIDDETRVINTRAIFDNEYNEILVNIPKYYKKNIIDFINDKTFRLIEIIKHEIVTGNFENIGLQIRFKISMTKQNADDANTTQEVHIVTPRYICTLNDLENVFRIIIKYLINRIFRALENIEGSGYTINFYDDFFIIVHQVYRITTPGYFGVEHPLTRTKRLVYNPRGNNPSDNLCYQRYIAVHVHRKENIDRGTKYNWKHVHRTFSKIKKN